MDLFERTLSAYEGKISNANIEKLAIENVSTSNLLIYNADNDILDYIFNIVLNKKPDEMKLLMFTSNNDIREIYRNIEHWLIPIVKENKKVLGALVWSHLEMQNRAKIFKETGINSFEEYNRVSDIKLPKILILIDDIYKWINYLSSKDLEEVTTAILDMDRMNSNKYGVQIIGITNYDTRNIELGRLKIVFNHVNYTELKEILNGKFVNISMDEILKENQKLAKQYEKIEENDEDPIEEEDEANPLLSDAIQLVMKTRQVSTSLEEEDEEDEADPLLSDAIQLVMETRQVSTAFIQRKFQVGYARAGRILDQMEELGVVSEYRGSAPREMIITKEEAENIIKKLK